MHILMVDDEEYTSADHREALEEAAHKITCVSSLQKAIDMLIASFLDEKLKIDFVLIDLMLATKRMPVFKIGNDSDKLSNYYDGLTIQEHNEGQALGQWLWESQGAHCIPDRPIHCYFTNVPSLYKSHREINKQEFAVPIDQNSTDLAHISKFILEKPDTLPAELVSDIAKIVYLWGQYNFKK